MRGDELRNGLPEGAVGLDHLGTAVRTGGSLQFVEVRHVLDPGGHLLLTDPIVTSWLRPFYVLGRARDRFHTAAELEAMLGDAGLRATRRSTVPGMWGAVTVTIAVPV